MIIRRTTTLIVAGIAATLLLALTLAVPALINVDRYRPQLISYLQGKTGKKVEIAGLALTYFPVTIHIDRIGVGTLRSFQLVMFSRWRGPMPNLASERSCTGKWLLSPS
jgi:uncharacterized protein involved in outer membrane biogenesis